MVRDLALPGRLHGLSFDLRRGEILGIAGLVGAGRTELLRCLAGAEPTADGLITVDGQEVHLPITVRQALRLGIALTPEDRKGQGFVPLMDGAQNVTLTDMAAVSRYGFVQRRRQRSLATRLAGLLGFDPQRLGHAVGTLSGGNQQKLVIGKWLHRQPAVLMLDEPTRGIDIGAKAEIFAAIRKLVDGGMSVILVSSELEEVVDNADRVLVMARGRRIATLEPPDISVDRILQLIFDVEDTAA